MTLPTDCAWRGSCEATQIASLAGRNSLRLGAEWNLGDGAPQDLMGGTSDEVPDRYALADPAALTPTPLPVTLVHGTSDTTVPLGMSQAYQAGRLVEVPGADHFDLVDPLSGACRTRSRRSGFPDRRRSGRPGSNASPIR